MSSTQISSSSFISPCSFPNKAINQSNNASTTLRSASHHPPTHASRQSTSTDAFVGHSRDDDPALRRVGNAEQSSEPGSLTSTQQDERAAPRSGPAFSETPQHFLNICHYINVVDSWEEACQNQFSVPASSSSGFQPSREIVTERRKILEFDDYSIIPEVNQALIKMRDERESLTVYPQDCGLPPSAFMKQSESVPIPTPASDVVIVDNRASNDTATNANSTPEIVTPSSHTVVEDDSIINVDNDNDEPQRVGTSQTSSHYDASVSGYAEIVEDDSIVNMDNDIIDIYNDEPQSVGNTQISSHYDASVSGYAESQSVPLEEALSSQTVSLDSVGFTLPQPRTFVEVQNFSGPSYDYQYLPQQPLLSGQSYYIPHPDTVNAANLDTTWEDGHYNPTLYDYNSNDVTLPTHNFNLQQAQNIQGRGFPAVVQGNSQNAIPSQYYLPQHYNNAMTAAHYLPTPTMTQPFPPHPLPATTGLPRAHTLPYPLPTFETNSSNASSLQKRKREADEVDAPKPTRPRKRRAAPATPTSITLPDNWDALMNSLSATDPRKAGPPCTIEQDKDKETYYTYTCLYSGPGPKEGGDTCKKGVTTNCRRNWLRHIGTHADDEEHLIRNGSLRPEDVHALLWVKKNTFRCTVEGCGFFAEEWRVDGIRQAHMKNCHGVDSQKRERNKGKGKENG